VGCRGANASSATPGSVATVATGTGFRATIDSSARVVTVEVGPFRIDPAGSAGSMVLTGPRVVAMPVDGWLQSVTVDLVDSSGRVLPRELIHHLNVIAPERRELFSPIMLRIGAAGPETPPIELPSVLGFRVRPGDSVLVTAMLHNGTARPHDDVRVRVRLGYTPAADMRPPPLSIFPFYLDVMPPAGVHAYDLPPGHSERYWQGRPAVAGRVLAVGGHLHRYGVALRFEDVTAHELLWKARPVIDSSGEVRAMPTEKFLWRLGIPLRPDHVYRLTAVYDNPTGRMIPDGAMGTLGGVFLPARGTTWARVERSDPQYQLDVRVTYDTTSMSEAMPEHGDMQQMKGHDSMDASGSAGPHSH
jgi:hypothetical protein